MKDPRSDVIRVMLVDDMRGARTGFMMMLNNAPDIIVSCQAADGAQAIGYLRESPHQLPDVILMDVRMPVMDGIEATGIIKEEFPQIRILILTTYDEDDYAFDGLARGLRVSCLRMPRRGNYVMLFMPYITAMPF